MTDNSLGVCRNADDLRAILRSRFAALGVSFETVDHLSGLPTRYTAKVLGLQPNRGFGQISLDALLGTAGIMLIAVEDAEALERIRNRLTPLQRVDHTAAPRRKIVVKLTRDFMRKIGRLGGLKSHAVASHKKHISDVNRQNALKRWRKPEDAGRLEGLAREQVEIDILGDRAHIGAPEAVAGTLGCQHLGVSDVHAEHADRREQVVVDLVHQAGDAVI